VPFPAEMFLLDSATFSVVAGTLRLELQNFIFLLLALAVVVEIPAPEPSWRLHAVGSDVTKMLAVVTLRQTSLGPVGVLEGQSDVLGRGVRWKMSNYYPESFIRFDVKGKIAEVMFIEIGQHGLVVGHTKLTKLRGRSPQANYTDRATAACRRS
jgi:hypothetical protein